MITRTCLNCFKNFEVDCEDDSHMCSVDCFIEYHELSKDEANELISFSADSGN